MPVSSIEDRELASPNGVVRVRICRPAGQVRGTLLHFYGGAFTLGSIDMIDPMARRLARDLSMVVVTSNYRLASEDPFPAGFNDALFTARWVLDHAGESGGEDLPIVLSGESAVECRDQRMGHAQIEVQAHLSFWLLDFSDGDRGPPGAHPPDEFILQSLGVTVGCGATCGQALGM